MFTWLPLFKEITNWILPYRRSQSDLCNVLRKIGFDSNLEDEDTKGRKPLTVMDPFTFFAFFMKIKNDENRTGYFRNLKELIGLKSELPRDYSGVPSAQPMALWYFGKYEKDRREDVMDLLWDLAEEAIKGELNEKSFQMVLSLPKIRIGKLSQGLYWLNPTIFYPIDVHKNYLEKYGINTEVETLSDYLAVLDKMKATFHKPFYEISYAAWLSNNEEEVADDNVAESEVAEKEISHLTNNSSMVSLNTILYGPPGTGKTYHTVNKSVSIANPDFDIANATREQIRTEYDRLVKDMQIEFIAFHQSMSYEDFIEGIKPVEPKEGDPFLKYEIKEGIFKRLCERAGKVPETKPTGFSISEEEFQKAGFYKISLGDTSNPDDDQIYDWCINNGYMALGWGDAIDFTGKKENEIQLMVPGQLEKFAAQAVNSFIHYAKKGDYVIVSYGNLLFRAVGKISGDYEYKNVEGLHVHQFRKVEWLLSDVELPYEEIYNRQFSQQSIYRMDKKGIKKEFLVKAGTVAKASDNKLKNYVLIIDEINRGNVSQIFGELITLIEEDKRSGKDEALTITLPYSKKQFSVPSNLYIIGTMNTADRSVEALDTALRRRFTFEEMKSNPRLLSPKAMLTRMLNTSESWNNDWKDEGYRNLADPLYELLGIEKSIETELKKRIEEVGDSWTEDHLDFLDGLEFSGLNLEILLSTINKRLEALLTKDHTIGHAWLMNVYSLEDLQAAFKSKILPLLQEFFYNDYAKIGLVLGDAFLDSQKSSKGIFAKFKDDNELAGEYEDKMIYTLKDPFELKLEDFKSIYQ